MDSEQLNIYRELQFTNLIRLVQIKPVFVLKDGIIIRMANLIKAGLARKC